MLPIIPSIVLVHNILPYLDDRQTWNNVIIANKDIYEQSLKAHDVAPWPNTILPIGVLVFSVAFSPPNGHLLACGCDDGSVRLWNRRTGPLKKLSLRGHLHSIQTVVFSHDGKYLASASYDRTIRVWSMEQIILLNNNNDGDDNDASYSSAQSAKAVLKGHDDRVTTIAWSKDGKSIASASVDETVRVWNASNGSCKSQWHIDMAGVTSMEFTSDANILAFGCWDGSIRLCDVANQTIKTIKQGGSMDWVPSLCFTNDGSVLASASGNSTISLWNLKDNQKQNQSLKQPPRGYVSLAFSADSKRMSFTTYNRIAIWDMSQQKNYGEKEEAEEDEEVVITMNSASVCSLQGHKEQVRSLCFSPNGRTLASGSFDGTVRLWGV